MLNVELTESAATGFAKAFDDFPTLDIEHYGIKRGAWLSKESNGGVGRRLKTSIGLGELRM
jgi:hypothetical protein